MERVPEVKQDVPGREEQFRWLLERLTGHEAFGRLRGSFIRQPDDRGVSERMAHLHRLAAGADSPTAFCRAWDAYAADMRVVGDILAQLLRDRWNDAALELTHALDFVGYTLPGETIRLDETVPVTVLIVDFPRTHAMLSWIRAGHWMDLDRYLDGEPVKPLAQQLFARFPSLKQHTTERRQRGDYEGWDLLAAYRDDVQYPFIREVLGAPINADRIGMETPLLHAARPMEIGYGTYNDHLEVTSVHGDRDHAFGFLFFADQADVLVQIPREHQHRVATWGFRLPTVIAERAQKERDGMSAVSVGFHPEQRHGDWQHAGGAYPSHGCSHGYGAVLLDRRRYQYQDHLGRYNQTYGGGYCSVKEEGETVAFLLQPR